MTFACSGSPTDARERLTAVIDGRPWNAAGVDGWIRGDHVVLYYRDGAKYRALFRPTFVGRLRQRDGRTVLDGRFRMTWFARALLPVWLAPAVVCIAVAVLGVLLGALALARFALERWGRPRDVEAISIAIRATVQPPAAGSR